MGAAGPGQDVEAEVAAGFDPAATRFFRTLLKKQGRRPRVLVTDKLASYHVAHRTTMSAAIGVPSAELDRTELGVRFQVWNQVTELTLVA
ncbi:hypothetical protein R3Q06_34000 [Rhodococcus erythropolis]|uniref:hypothetical protein n=1 Tax=Rhodococcus erythropolis TaxID=1833 RepID=UPI002949B8A6|nr:hypothetical protein [Rhodococcus erythropolis]MDV6278438.1 hypothetical protein [Rhodococcus erythropolis]